MSREPQAKAPIKLAPNMFQMLSDSGARGVVYCRVPSTHTIDDVLHPDYFSQCLAYPKNLRRGDVIEVEPHDLSWSLYLTVLKVELSDPRAPKVVTRVKDVRHFEAVPEETAEDLRLQRERAVASGSSRW